MIQIHSKSMYQYTKKSMQNKFFFFTKHKPWRPLLISKLQELQNMQQ